MVKFQHRTGVRPTMSTTPITLTQTTSTSNRNHVPPETAQTSIQSESWITVSAKRKGSPNIKTPAGKQTKITNCWLGPTSTKNRFDGLIDADVDPQPIIESKPPPNFRK